MEVHYQLSISSSAHFMDTALPKCSDPVWFRDVLHIAYRNSQANIKFYKTRPSAKKVWYHFMTLQWHLVCVAMWSIAIISSGAVVWACISPGLPMPVLQVRNGLGLACSYKRVDCALSDLDHMHIFGVIIWLPMSSVQHIASSLK